MDQNRQVDVATLLNSIAGQLSQSQEGLNSLDRKGSHGQRMAQAFRLAADAAGQAGTDAGEQLERAALAMRQGGKGKAARFYADGLEEAAQQFRGQQGISMDSVLPFLQAMANGVQRNNPAQPGQGTMIDVLLPAVQGMMSGQQRGQGAQGSIIDILSGAVSGAQRTQRGQGQMDPGAASAVNVIGGILGALAPSIISALMNRGAGGAGAGTSRQKGPYSGIPDQPPAPQQGADPLGGLGGLLGGLLGGGQSLQGGGQYGEGLDVPSNRSGIEGMLDSLGQGMPDDRDRR